MITKSYNNLITKKYVCPKCNKEFKQIYVTYKGNKCLCGCELKEKENESGTGSQEM